MESLRNIVDGATPDVRRRVSVSKKARKIPQGCVSFEEFSEVFEQKLNAEYAKL